MALHPVKLPKSAHYLFQVVVLQKRLLKALSNPSLNANVVNTAWVQNVWHYQDAEWVRKFCLGGQQSVLHPLKAIAAAPLVARKSLYSEFCRQNKIAEMLDEGGNFQNIKGLPGFTTQLAIHVEVFFKQCYKLLSHDTRNGWNGYEFNGGHAVSNRSYKDDFCSDYPTRIVCPYCDGEIGTPELDHYLCKSEFPLLACSPWNLIPVCPSCNKIVTGKGESPAITLGPPHSTDDWLHPFFRPASDDVQIKLDGPPMNVIPRLHSPNAAEQTRLDNHTCLIRSLSKRWTNVAAGYFDHLVCKANQKVPTGNHLQKNISARELVRTQLEDHMCCRGRTASSMVYAAVCQAVLDGRPEYIEEFIKPNTPKLE